MHLTELDIIDTFFLVMRVLLVMDNLALFSKQIKSNSTKISLASSWY